MTDRFILANGQIIRVDGEVVELTPHEAVLVGGLWKHRGYYIHRTRQATWLYGSRDSWPDHWDSCVSVFHSRLRDKITKCSFTIEHKYEYGDQFRGHLIVDAADAHPCDSEPA